MADCALIGTLKIIAQNRVVPASRARETQGKPANINILRFVASGHFPLHAIGEPTFTVDKWFAPFEAAR